MRVHFICRGNAYRSRLAEAYLKSLGTDIEVVSSGTVADAHRQQNARVIELVKDFLQSKALGKGLNYEPQQLTQERLQPDDAVIFMSQRARDESTGLQLPQNTTTWDVKDFDEVYPNPDSSDPAFPAQFLDYTGQIFKQIQTNIDELVTKLKDK